jgi:hypothetical protein
MSGLNYRMLTGMIHHQILRTILPYGSQRDIDRAGDLLAKHHRGLITPLELLQCMAELTEDCLTGTEEWERASTFGQYMM